MDGIIGISQDGRIHIRNIDGEMFFGSIEEFIGSVKIWQEAIMFHLPDILIQRAPYSDFVQEVLLENSILARN